MKLSLHCPDRDNFTDDEMAAIRDLNPASLLVCAFDDDKGGVTQTMNMCQQLGITDLLVRIMGDGIANNNAKDWVAVCRERARRYLWSGGPIVHVLPGNEMNYAGEGFNGDLPGLMNWLEDFGKAWGKSDALTIHLPAPWSGWVGENNADAKRYWQAAKDKGLGRYYKEIDAHCYADGYDLWRDCAAIWGKGPWITEFNRVPFADAVKALDPAEPRPAKAAVYFTLKWECYSDCTEDGWRKDDQFSLMRYPDLYTEFKTVNSGVEESPPAIIVDPIEDPPREAPVPELVSAIDISSNQAIGAVPGIIDQYNPDHVIVRLYLPGERPSQQWTKDAVQIARDKGKTVGGYLWGYRSFDPEKSLTDALELCASINLVLPLIWVDCETYGDPVTDEGPDAEWLTRFIALADALETPVGIYTGQWWVDGHFPGGFAAYESFITRPHWLSIYDGVQNLDSTTAWNGRVNMVGKQFTGSPIDQSVLAKEWSVVAPSVLPPPVDDPCADIKTRLTAIYHEIGELLGV